MEENLSSGVCIASSSRRIVARPVPPLDISYGQVISRSNLCPGMFQTYSDLWSTIVIV